MEVIEYEYLYFKKKYKSVCRYCDPLIKPNKISAPGDLKIKKDPEN